MLKKVFRFLGYFTLLGICGFVWYVVGNANYKPEEMQGMVFGLFIFLIFTIVIIVSVYHSFIDLFKHNGNDNRDFR